MVRPLAGSQGFEPSFARKAREGEAEGELPDHRCLVEASLHFRERKSVKGHDSAVSLRQDCAECLHNGPPACQDRSTAQSSGPSSPDSSPDWVCPPFADGLPPPSFRSDLRDRPASGLAIRARPSGSGPAQTHSFRTFRNPRIRKASATSFEFGSIRHALRRSSTAVTVSPSISS